MYWYVVCKYDLPRGYTDSYINTSVYGWFQDSFTGVEQDLSYLLEVGYQKGAQQAGLDLLFLTTAQPILSGIHDHIKSKASCMR